jgi:tRNA(Ile)-lysidine synthase
VDIIGFRKIILEQCRLDPNRVVVVGVSGGPDSLCLLDLLFRLEIPIVIAHFDHALRPDSAGDVEFVRQIAKSLDLPFVTARQNVALLAQAEHLSIEEAARNARYQFLFNQAVELNAQAVAVAHTADDQVETVLMHLLRGSGIHGLKGMTFRTEQTQWIAGIPLVRPLLKTWRAEIEAYCHNRDLAPLMDPSNQETVFFRNRLRHQLIPTLQEYNPRIKEVVWRMAQTLAGDLEILEELFEPIWKNCLVRQGNGYVCLSLPVLQLLLPGQQRTVLRRAIQIMQPGLRDFEFKTIERGRNFVNNPSATSQLDLAAGLRLFVENDLLFLAKWGTTILDQEWPQIPPGKTWILPLEGQLALADDWLLTVRIGESVPSETNWNSPGPTRVWLDLETVSMPLIVRTRQPGDRFQALGLNGHSLKLSNFFINEHLNQRARDGWPLICSGEQIVWIPGFRPAHFCRITEATQKTILIELSGSRAGA